MLTKIKNNKEIISTTLCVIFILIGLLFEKSNLSLWATLAYITGFVIGGWQSALEGWQELVDDKHLSVDILMILAAIGAGIIGYWMEGALLIFIFSLSETLEHYTMQKSKRTIEQLMSVTPDKTLVKRDGVFTETLVTQVRVGEIIQVKKGDVVPLDGKLISDFASLNEASLTGESLPASKSKNDPITSGTLNIENIFEMMVTASYENSYFNKIVAMVEEAQSRQSQTDKLVTRIEDTYVKIVLTVVPLFILLTPFVFQWDWQTAFYRGMVLLTVASPCALVASASPANLAAISRAAKKGILVKGGDTFDAIDQLTTFVFDKTGTLTTGQPVVIHDYYENSHHIDEVKSIVYNTELTSTHPLATALVNYLKGQPSLELEIEDVTGKGFIIHDSLQNIWHIGKQAFVQEYCHQEIPHQETIDNFQAKGQTVIFVAKNNAFAAYYVLEDQVNETSATTIKQLHALNIQTVMLTGDNPLTANHVATQIGIDQVKANCLPQDKLTYIDDLKNQGEIVAMTGDGINDAPALALADIGIGMGEGTDVAIETSDIVIVKNDLSLIPYLIQLTKKMNRIVLFNLIFSISVIILLVFANVFQVINLPLGVVGHEGSTILVILNGLRLLNFDAE